MKRTHEDMAGDDHPNDHPDGHDDANLSDDDDDVGKIAPYDAKKEPRPPCKLYDPDYKKIREDLQTCIDLFASPFHQTSFNSGSTQGLLEELKRRLQDKSAEKVRIGVVGDMKSGKSSVINSILSVGMIARQGDAGGSCTWVINEFCHLLPNQSKSFAAEIYFFSQKQRHAIIKGLLADYFRANGKDEDKSDGEKDSEQSLDDFATMQTVVTAFRALFIAAPEFATPTKAHEYLSEAESEHDVEVLRYLYELSDEVMAGCLKGFTHIRHEAATPQSLLMLLAPYQYTVQERGGDPLPSLWPFVKHIKFGLDCEVLKSVTLVDLPGLSDANKTRAATSVAHLRTCTHSMIVAEIGRATDDKFIREQLQKGFMTRGSGNTMLVLTHCDTIDDATEVSMTRKGQQQLDELEEKMVKLEDKKKQYTSKVKKTPKGMQQYEYMEIRDQTTLELREAKAQHKELRIHCRSRNIAREMQRLYTELTSDPVQLAVFCVGNAAYKKHQAGYLVDDANPPTLSVKGTKIPDLRQHLFLAPAQGQLNETDNQCLVQLPVIKSTFGLYVSKAHMARKDEIERAVREPLKKVPAMVDEAMEKLKSDAESTILHLWREDELDWTNEAQKLCKQWAHGNTTARHLAMLKNDGVQRGRSKGPNIVSWNAELIFINSNEVRVWLKSFQPALDPLVQWVVEQVTSMTNKMLTTIRTHDHVALMALKPFLEYIAAEKGTINARAKTPAKDFRREMNNIFRAALSEDVENPVVRAMAPVYAHAREIKGKRGKPRDRLEAFQRDITTSGKGVWMTAHDLLRKDMFAAMDAYAEALRKAMTDFFVGIDKTFNLMCADEGEESEEEAQFREAQAKNLVKVEEIMEKELLPRAKKFFET